MSNAKGLFMDEAFLHPGACAPFFEMIFKQSLKYWKIDQKIGAHISTLYVLTKSFRENWHFLCHV
jgi:hypothetical protein